MSLPWWLVLSWAADPTTVVADGGAPGALTIVSAEHTDAGLVVVADVGHDPKQAATQYVGLTVTTGFGDHLHAPVVDLTTGVHHRVTFTVPDASFATSVELARWNRKLACGPKPADVPVLDPEPEYDWDHDCNGHGPNACDRLGYAVCDRRDTRNADASLPAARWTQLRRDGTLVGQPVRSSEVRDGAELSTHGPCRLFTSNSFLVVMEGAVPRVLARHEAVDELHTTWFPERKTLLVQAGDRSRYFVEPVASCFGGA